MRLKNPSDGFTSLLNWNAPAFDHILRPRKKNGKPTKTFEVPPTSIVTDGDDFHIRFHTLVPFQCHDEDGKPVDKVLQWNNNYMVMKKKDPPVMTTVAELCEAGGTGMVGAHEFLADVRRILSSTDPTNKMERKMAQNVHRIISDDGAWAALDPGYKFVGTRNDGWALPIGLQYGTKRKKDPPKQVQEALTALQALTLHGDDVQARLTSLGKWVGLQSKLVEYYGRPVARAQRVSRSRNKASLMDRTVHGILTAPKGTTY
jgi:hypothetical protein